MEFFESLSTERDSAKAIEEALSAAAEGFGAAAPDLGFLFFSGHHREAAEGFALEVKARTGVRMLLGCTGESIVGGGREIEGEPSLSLWLASLPGVQIDPFYVRCEQTPDGFCFPCDPCGLFETPGENAAVLLIGEPFTMPIDMFLRRFNEDHPGVPVIGGMASGTAYPGPNLLVMDGEVKTEGAVGVLLSGALRVCPIVSQGCRPIGRHLVITEAEKNAILGLGGKPALSVVQEMFEEIPPEDRRLFQSAPHVGVVMNERQSCFGAGDFLIRNIVGADPARGSIFISDLVRRGQTVQFHVRDGATASEDLAAMLNLLDSREGEVRPAGGLMFSCNGRGTRLFARPDHDIATLLDIVGPIPISGFFAQGELGPVGDRNHLHGFTTCFALFYDA